MIPYFQISFDPTFTTVRARFCNHLVHKSEKAMAPHSSTFAWKVPWMEESGRLQSMGSLESDTTERLHFHFSLSCVGEGNGNPLQCSHVENPREGKPGGLPSMGSQNRTRLKQRSSSSSSSSQIISSYKKAFPTCLNCQYFWGMLSFGKCENFVELVD